MLVAAARPTTTVATRLPLMPMPNTSVIYSHIYRDDIHTADDSPVVSKAVTDTTGRRSRPRCGARGRRAGQHKGRASPCVQTSLPQTFYHHHPLPNIFLEPTGDACPSSSPACRPVSLTRRRVLYASLLRYIRCRAYELGVGYAAGSQLTIVLSTQSQVAYPSPTARA